MIAIGPPRRAWSFRAFQIVGWASVLAALLPAATAVCDDRGAGAPALAAQADPGAPAAPTITTTAPTVPPAAADAGDAGTAAPASPTGAAPTTPVAPDVAGADAGASTGLGAGTGAFDLGGGASPAIAEATTDDHIELTGWAADIGTALALGTGAPPADNPIRIPRDLTANRLSLYLQARYHRGALTFVSSGALRQGVRLVREGTTIPGAQRPVQARYDVESTLQELYVAGRVASGIDLAIGQQRIAWGRNEVFAINDVINSRDLRNVMLEPAELRYLPVIAARADLSKGPFSLQLVAAPFFRPHDIVFFGTSWAVVQDQSPRIYQAILTGAEAQITDSGLFAPGRGVNNNWSQTATGERLTLRLGGVDLAAYHHWGLDPTPRWTFDQTLLYALLDSNLQMDPNAMAAALAAFAATVQVSYIRRHHAGLSAQSDLGPFIAYGEAAYDSRMVIPTRNLHTAAPTLWQGVLGLEYQLDLDKDVDLAVRYQHLDQWDPVDPPLWYLQDNVSIALNARWAIVERLVFDTEGVVGVHPFQYTARAELTFKRSRLAASLGATLLGGEDFSFGSYFRVNQGIYARLKWFL